MSGAGAGPKGLRTPPAWLRPGPVLAHERRRIARARRTYILRAAVVAVLLAAFTETWRSWARSEVDPMRLALLGTRLYHETAAWLMTLVLLIAPAATAGSVGRDKATGALLLEMTTDLTDAEIVLGRLYAALLPVVGLVVAALPVLMLGTLLGGVSPTGLLRTFLVILATGVAAGSLGFAQSVRYERTHLAIGGAYLIILVVMNFGMLAYPVHPYILILHPGESPGIRAAIYVVGCLLTAVALAEWSAATVRDAALRPPVPVPPPKSATAARRRRRWLLADPKLDDDPVLWREWKRQDGPTAGMGIWRAYQVEGLFFGGMAVLAAASDRSMTAGFAAVFLLAVVLPGLLLLTARAAASMADDRDRGTLEVLLATPLTEREILGGKWRAAYRMSLIVVAAPTLVGALLSLRTGAWLRALALPGLLAAYAASATSLGIAVGVWARRPRGATAWSVGLCVASWVLWPILAGGFLGHLAGFGSPPVGVFASLTAIRPPFLVARDVFPPWVSIAWTAIHGLLAWLVFLAACRSVPRCLGRTYDEPTL